MIKTLLTISLLGTAATAYAAGVGPEIAFAKGGSRPEIYLINPDSSGARLVYRGASRKRIFSVSLRPGGGELSFEEAPCCTSNGPFYLKTVTYGATGAGAVARSISLSCRVSSIDYHPTDGSLIYVGCGSKILRLAQGSQTAVDVGVARAFKAAWSGPNHILYVNDALRRVAVATPGQSELIVPTNCVARLNPGQSGAIALLSIGSACRGSNAIDLVNVTAKSQQTSIELGQSADLAAGDSDFIYISPPQNGGSYLLVRSVSSRGTLFRVGSKADYTSVDWRN